MNSNRQIDGLEPTEARTALMPRTTSASAIDAVEYQQGLEHARTLLRERGENALPGTAGTSLRYFSAVAPAPSERLVALLLSLSGDPVMACAAFKGLRKGLTPPCIR
jgi:Xaa-Pro dipeptidase